MTDYKKILRYALLVAGMVLACRLTNSYFALAVIGAAFANAWSRKPTFAILCCIMLSFVNCVTGYIIGQRFALMLAYRIGVPLVGLALCSSLSGRRGKIEVPLAGLFAYCAVATISSFFGYAPRISLSKLAYFNIFILFVLCVTKSVAMDIDIAVNVRHFFLAICVALLIGSLCTLAFPAVAYPLNSRYLMMQGMNLSSANEAMSDGFVSLGMPLFAGITYHSQMLGPILVFAVVFLMCDMLFVECHITLFHSILLALGFVFAYMTRSRTALLGLLLVFFAIANVAVSVKNMLPILQRRVRAIMTVVIVLLAVAGGVAESRSSILSKWFRKGSSSEVSSFEAATRTRMGAVKVLLQDFRKSPLLGCGFQVDEESARLEEGGGLVLSDSIEKGILPLMVLSECGIIGAFLFAYFLFSFFINCRRQELFCTMLGLTGFIFTNFGEATFFSPGATGGLGWVFAIAGGFVLDVIKKNPKALLRHN